MFLFITLEIPVTKYELISHVSLQIITVLSQLIFGSLRQGLNTQTLRGTVDADLSIKQSYRHKKLSEDPSAVVSVDLQFQHTFLRLINLCQHYF